MKFSLLFLHSTPDGKTDDKIYEEVFEAIDLAERVGYDGVWLAEHHFTDYGRPSINVLAGAVAARTKRVRIGTAVSILPLHNPIDLAEDFATVDVISEGRLDFGIGRGYQPRELAPFGVELRETRERLTETLEIILKAWTQDEFTYEGKYHLSVFPRPIQKPHPPIFQPTVSRSTIELVVQAGINPILTGYGNLDQFRNMSWDPFVDAAEKMGKSVKGIDWVLNRITHVAKTKKLAWERAEPCMWWVRGLADLTTRGIPGRPEYQAPPDMEKQANWLRSLSYEDFAKNQLIGDPESVIGEIRAWQKALGLKHLLSYMHMAKIPHEDIMDSIEIFGKKVIPAVRDL
jgi:alkanesulfonate monooxygenase SsuD/methylene tetrahydromethanopterin reductase-like flavin-dependent oxidoreductase (luciferase family)